jgi:hypothetical protein
MKKFICMLTVLLCSVMNLSAQNFDLEGRWEAEASEGNARGLLILQFEGDQLEQAVYGESSIDEIGFIGVTLSLPPAPYKLNGNILTTATDTSKAELQITKTEFNDNIKEAIKADPSLESTMLEMLKKSFATEKDEIANNVFINGSMEIVSCIDGELKVKDKGRAIVTFYLKGE